MKGDFGPLWVPTDQVSDRELMRRIKATCAGPSEFKPEPALVDAVLVNPLPRRVLDFGGGMGRNALGLVRAAADIGHGLQVVVYDNPQMLARARTYLEREAPGVLSGGLAGAPIILEDDWAVVQEWAGWRTVDTVMVSLVLQHMAPDEVAARCAQFARMARRVVVLSRLAFDMRRGGGAVLDVVGRSIGDDWTRTRLEHDPAGSCHPGHWIGVWDAPAGEAREGVE